MNATPVNQSQRELVRLLVVEHGQKKAADLSQVPYETVRKWTQRGHWLSASQSVPKTIQTTVNRVVDELQESERETKLSLARYARNTARENEGAGLEQAPMLHKVGQLAGLVHKWGEQGKTGNQFTLNVLNINSLAIDQEQTLD